MFYGNDNQNCYNGLERTCLFSICLFTHITFFKDNQIIIIFLYGLYRGVVSCLESLNPQGLFLMVCLVLVIVFHLT